MALLFTNYHLPRASNETSSCANPRSSFSLINETIASDQPVRASVSGIITDSRTGETLINASVVIKGTTTGTVTNASGFYTFSDLRAGNYTFQFTYVGYQPIERDITLVEGERLRLDVSWTPADFILEEVVVQADQEREEARNIGTARISTQLIKDIPAVLQADVFRSVQLLPGVKAASDFFLGSVHTRWWSGPDTHSAGQNPRCITPPTSSAFSQHSTLTPSRMCNCSRAAIRLSSEAGWDRY